MDFEKLKHFMNFLSTEFTPGCCVSVYKDGKNVFKYAVGYSDAENDIILHGNELYFLYSCSKVATVTAALQLYEKGLFLLDDPLYEYIPEFRNMTVKDENGNIKDAVSDITIKQLFTMTAGFDYNTNTKGFEKARVLTEGIMNTMDVIRSIADDPLSFEPGTKWQYSLCHDVLGGVVEVISGKKFGDYVKENIFEPLGMNNSFYHLPKDKESMLCEQYIYETDDHEHDIVKLQMSNKRGNGYIRKTEKSSNLTFGDEYDSGGAGIISSCDDYLKFMAALAGGGKNAEGVKILSSSTVDLMRSAHLPKEFLKYYTWPDLKGYSYGLGVRTMVDRVAGGCLSSVGEFGWSGAAGSTTLVDPENNLAMVYCQHVLNPNAHYYQPRLRNVLYSCIK